MAGQGGHWCAAAHSVNLSKITWGGTEKKQVRSSDLGQHCKLWGKYQAFLCFLFICLSVYLLVLSEYILVEQKELDQGEYLVRKAVSLFFSQFLHIRKPFQGIHIEQSEEPAYV